MVDLNSIKKIYFIGIGGIGVSAAAGILKARGLVVSGSDAALSELVDDLRHRGIEVKVPHRAENLTDDFEAVVYSVAVPEDNPEIVKAKELKLPLLTYPQLLGLLVSEKYGLGVSGTDGKTTTTAMLAKIMLDAKLDPTVVLGAKADFLEDNWRYGQNRYFVFEADEYRRAFVNYAPQLAIVTNIGLDHLDYYKDQTDYLNAFKDYLKKLPPDGFAVINNDNDNAIAAALKSRAKVVTFAIKNSADYQAEILGIATGYQIFKIKEKGNDVGEFKISLPGEYNVYNALAAVAAARTIGVDWPIIKESLDSFKGAWRRWQALGFCEGAEVIADYAHTPDAVAKAIKAARDFYPSKKILTVFQPHQYARTKNLFIDFIKAFDGAQKVLLPDIFYVKGRENPADFDVSSARLAEEAGKRGVDIEASGDLAASEEKIRIIADQYDVILVLGAGDVYELAKRLAK